MDDRLGAALAEALGEEVRGASVVRGGDTAAAYRVELRSGAVVFAKTHPAPPPGFFSTEAASLRWLASAAPAPVGVAEVLAVDDGDGDGGRPAFLALRWIPEGHAGPTSHDDLGAGLAALHRAGAPHFGRSDGRTTGSLALPNAPCATWAQFTATQRLLPLARLARDRAALDEGVIGELERLAHRLDQLAVPEEPPARLHGDLWAGNRLFDTAGRPWLVDPAAHGGHREFDLAMMRLFGGFAEATFRAYDDHHPLAPGAEDRVPLHQVAPLVVHAVKFGGAYRAAAAAAIRHAR